MNEAHTGFIAVFQAAASPDLARSLDLSGHPWKAVESLDEAAEFEPANGWTACIVDTSEAPDSAWAFARGIRKADNRPIPLMVLVSGSQLDQLEMRDDLFDDFCISPFHPVEFEARLRHLLWGSGETTTVSDVISYGALELNLETYQATIDGRPLDLTYMEYELLRFLAQSPGRVFSREILLSRVWGYEYYGGARTVDVHVRRLRAKLGEEHSALIHTVRSVGYRFGESIWGRAANQS